MKLSELIQDIPVISKRMEKDPDIAAVTKDSRSVRENTLFFATAKSDQYIADAREKGAPALVTDKDTNQPFPAVLEVSDVTRALGKMAARLNGFPSRKMHVAGITGTNGKTTTTYLIESILKCARKKPGVIGTISYRYDGKELPAGNTTPGAAEIQGLLKDMEDVRVTNVIMEVSSHALDQRRVESIDFDVAIFTNLTHDHLDYHGDFEHYKAAKKMLFEDYLQSSSKKNRYAIINIDDPGVLGFVINVPVETLSFSTRGYADAYLEHYNEDITGLTLDISLMNHKVSLRSPLIGLFNASNILAAALYGITANIPVEQIKEGIEKIEGVPGRLERIKNDRGVSAFVDYAHTPDALRNVLALLKNLKKGRLIVVFGCGGDRDKIKRPIMGSIASQFADISIITSDNPRGENPAAIIDEIRKGFNGDPHAVIENRRDAIREAVRLARENDVLLVAGKGHENYQIIGGNTYHFSDRETLEEAFNVAP